MDLQPIVPWLSAAALIISLGTSVSTLLTSGAKQNAKKIADLDESSKGLESRVQELETEMRHMPDKDAVHRLELTLKDMSAEIMKIGTSADQSARTTARVEAYLLEQKKSRA
ncbi:DUF2730 family protein [Nitratireductor aquimarinus]|uniref:DUF2730 family protein n=1 Tax=Nitratireductor aquimarinus TaxID=889300 RepID=UPI001A8E6BE3|nr:DUF2730 family protein [Nitratireductor aquimarinus]MBN8243294.1 DUF2730 family protein [Nitratireductor aquimarinus]MBY6131195.1 DUF2730 domain-containing protein [Nitratireductor aquimarinus]MCA1302049.1 DUF2730 domain-containing protein [Nitratireductor aquimarinus]